MLLRWLFFSFLPGVTTANHILYFISQLFYIRVIVSSSQIWFLLALWVYLKDRIETSLLCIIEGEPMILKEQTGYWNLDGGLLLFWEKGL